MYDNVLFELCEAYIAAQTRYNRSRSLVDKGPIQEVKEELRLHLQLVATESKE